MRPECPLKDRTEYSVTAIITTHNREDILPRAVKSVFDQTYDDIDLIVVDDASTDGTQKYLTNLADRYERVTYIRISPEETRGANHARNVGIAAAAGRLIAFLDDDDVWLPHKTERQIAFFKRRPEVRALSSDWIDAYCINGKTYRFRCEYRFNFGKLEYFVTPYFSITSTFMVYKSCLLEIGGFDIELPELHEVDLAYRLCMNYTVGYIKEPSFIYYHMIGQSYISNNADSYITALELVEKKYSPYLSRLTDRQLEARKAHAAFDISERYFRSGDMKAYRNLVKPYFEKLGKRDRLKYYLSYFCSTKTIMDINIHLILLKESLKKIRRR